LATKLLIILKRTKQVNEKMSLLGQNNLPTDQNLTKKIKIDQNDFVIPNGSPTFAEKSYGKEMDYNGADAPEFEKRPR